MGVQPPFSAKRCRLPASSTAKTAPSVNGANTAMIGSASASPAKPLASGTKRPERSPLGNGLAPQEGLPPPTLGSIQIWKMRVVSGSRLNSAWRMPLPALITCTSPASVRPLLPRLSWWVIAPVRT